MAMVRKQEEIRLRARDLKVLKKQAVLLEKDEDIYDKLLFHFLAADGIPPQTGQQINSIALVVDDREVGRIDVGSPMDNSADHLNYLMDSPGYMDWGPARRNQEGPYREYIDCAGSYGHAPFEFAVAKTFLQGPGTRTFRLEISARVSQQILVEIYNQKEYVQVGALQPGRTEHHFEFSGALLEGEEVANLESHLLAQSPVPAAASSLDDYGKGGARISALASRPEGAPEDSDFALNEDALPAPAAGELLLRTIYLSLDPYMRGRMNAVKSYSPFVEIGETMVGGTVSEVMSSDVEGFAPGDLVFAYSGWQTHAVGDGKGLRKLDKNAAPISTALGILGMPGHTAYVGLLDIGRPKPGETVVVSAASGAVGRMQFALTAGQRRGEEEFAVKDC